jgi:hypothetical protein
VATEKVIVQKDKKLRIYEKCLIGYRDYFSKDTILDTSGEVLLVIDIDIEQPKDLSLIDESKRVLILKAVRANDRKLYDRIADNYKIYMDEQLFLKVMDKHIEKYIDVCPECKGTGYVKDELGIAVRCTCQNKQFVTNNNNTNKKKTKIDLETETIYDRVKVITGSDKIDTKYDTNKVIKEIQTTASKNHFKLVNFKEYDAKLHCIIDTIKAGNYKELNSYLLGAPANFGQEDFIDECLIALIQQGAKVVPYDSIMSLMEKKIAENQRVVSMVTQSETIPKPKGFSWTDYIKADVVFTRLDDLDNRFMESKALYMLLQNRNRMKLPTIVMTNFNLQLYTNDARLRNNFWDDILNYKSTEDKYKLNHLSTFKKYE